MIKIKDPIDAFRENDINEAEELITSWIKSAAHPAPETHSSVHMDKKSVVKHIIIAENLTLTDSAIKAFS